MRRPNMALKSIFGILEQKTLGGFRLPQIFTKEIMSVLCTMNLNVSITKIHSMIKITNILEHDVKKLDSTWFESPFADGIEATIIITWVSKDQKWNKGMKTLISTAFFKPVEYKLKNLIQHLSNEDLMKRRFDFCEKSLVEFRNHIPIKFIKISFII